MLNQICAYWKSIYEFPPIIIMTRHCRGKEIQKIARKIHSSPETLILMGFLDKLVSALGLRKKEANVLVVGLDNSGFLTFWNLIITVPKKAIIWTQDPLKYSYFQANRHFWTTSSQSRSRTPTLCQQWASMLRSSKVRYYRCYGILCTKAPLK